MKALFRCEKNWQKINVQRFSANFLFSKNGKCRSITYSGDFATLPFYAILFFLRISLLSCSYFCILGIRFFCQVHFLFSIQILVFLFCKT